MATKNLARTVVEGGSATSSKFERRQFTRSERFAARHALRTVLSNPGEADLVIVPKRKRQYREFADKTSPVDHWLDSRIGKLWDESRAILTARFDRRNLKGWHLIDTHMLYDVKTEGPHNRSVYGYRIDAHGRLTHRVMPRYTFERDLKSYEPAVSKWLNGRRIVVRGRFLFWKVVARVQTIYPNAVFFPFKTNLRNAVVKKFYRQDRKFTPEEKNFFYSLSKKARQELLLQA